MHALCTTQDLKASLNSFQDAKVGIIGDVMLDCYIYGSVERISPEAPVPVVNVAKELFALGGAGNVANNVKALGGDPVLISATGDDATSLQIESLLKTSQIENILIRDESRPSCLKTRVIGQHQQIVRFDKENTTAYAPEISKSLLDAFQSIVISCDYVIISDYAKGLISQELMAGVNKILQSKKSPAKLLIDPKPIHLNYFSNAYLLTPNAKEAGKSIGMGTPKNTAEIISVGKAMMQRYHCENLLITLGPQGMALFYSDGKIWHIPTMAQNVYDVTGAGDTVVALVGLGVSAGCSLLASCILANYAAGLVVGRLGTACVTRDEINAALDLSPSPILSEWTDKV